MERNNLKHWRIKKYLTQTQLSEILGITKSLVCMIEAGKAIISIKFKQRIIKEFGEEELFKITGEANGYD